MQTRRPASFGSVRITASCAAGRAAGVWQILSLKILDCGPASGPRNPGKVLVTGFFALLLLAMAPSIQAREAGWVPIEKYSSPLLKGGESAGTPKSASSKKNGAGKKAVAPVAPARRNENSSVYEGQAPITEKELLAFVEILPQFRRWAHSQKEDAHPTLRNGQADFLFSPRAGDWVKEHGWDAPRFFCVMGKMAAALVIVEEGNDMQGTRPADMPPVAPQELSLARKHLGSLLKVSYQGGAVRQ